MNAILVLFGLITIACGQVIKTPPQNASFYAGFTGSVFCGVPATHTANDFEFYKTFPTPATMLSKGTNLINKTKHGIEGKYKLLIYNLTSSDDGEYECRYQPLQGTRESHKVWLRVIENSTTSRSEMFYNWQNVPKINRAPLGKPVNVTCRVYDVRPHPEFRWLWKNADISKSNLSYYPAQQTTSNGGVLSESIQTFTFTKSDANQLLTCCVDLPYRQNFTVIQKAISFSGSNSILPCWIILAAALLSSLVLPETK